jgi:hypothetical protein
VPALQDRPAHHDVDIKEMLQAIPDFRTAEEEGLSRIWNPSDIWVLLQSVWVDSSLFSVKEPDVVAVVDLLHKPSGLLGVPCAWRVTRGGSGG